MRAEVIDDMVEGNREVVEHRLCLRLVIIIRNGLVENAPVSGFLDICTDGEDHPQRIIGEVAADIRVALLGEGLILVIAAAVLKLGGSQVDQSISCSVRNLVDEAEDILVGITEAHASADTALEVGCGTGEIKGNHALILVPDIDHTVDLVIRGVDIEDAEELIPCRTQLSQTGSNLFRGIVLLDHLISLFLIDGNAVRLELLVCGHFDITEDKDQRLCFAGCKCNFLIVGSDRRPAVCEGIGSLTVRNSLRIAEAVIETDEGIAVGIISVDRVVHGIESVMVTSVSVFGLMVNRRAFDFHASGREVSLEVGAVVLCIPEAPFREGEELECFGRITFVGQNELLDFAVIILRNEEGCFRLQSVLLTGNYGIAHTVAALIEIERSLDRRPAGVPDGAVVGNIEISAAHINRDIIIAIAGNTAQTCVLIEMIAARGIGNQRKESLCTEVVDPRIRSLGRLNDVFFVRVIEVTEFLHEKLRSFFCVVLTSFAADVFYVQSAREYNQL